MIPKWEVIKLLTKAFQSDGEDKTGSFLLYVSFNFQRQYSMMVTIMN